MDYHPRSIREATSAAPIAKRVVVVVIDGLRPDAIEEFVLSNIRTIAELGASTLTAQSVSPPFGTTSVASLMTGVSPSEHGMRSNQLSFPRHLGRLETLPRTVAGEGYQTSGFMSEVRPTIRGTAALLGRELGFQSLAFRGNSSAEIVRSALPALCSQRRGLIAIHLSDADNAGHEDGWMSHAYGVALRKIDQAIGILNALSAPRSSETLLVIVSAHGGGGEHPMNHMSDHPHDLTIPIILAGRHVARATLGNASLLDVPATILWALGIPVPRNYEGRVLGEAFDDVKSRARVLA